MCPTPSDDQDLDQSGAKAASRWQSAAGGVRALLAWRKGNRLRAGLVLGVCFALVSGVVGGWVAIASYRSTGPEVTLEITLETLDVGAYGKAREMAKKLKQQGTLPIEELGAPAFVLGAATAYESDEAWVKNKTNSYLLAARYLEEARDRGFPPGRRGEGLYLLGRSLYLSGQIPASRLVLFEALKFNKRKKTEIHRLLADAYFGDANPQLEKALAESSLYLADPRLPGPRRHEGLVQRARILLRLQRIGECVATLEKVPPSATNHADAMVIRGRLLMREGRLLKNKPNATAAELVEADNKYKAARKTLRLAQGRDTLSTQATRKATYLIGMCYLEQGQNREALAQFSRVNKLYGDLPEGLAASFREAELSRQLGSDKTALAAYRRVLSAITRPEDFSNPWITLDQLRSRVLDAYQYYAKTEKFEIALQLTRDLHPLFSRPRTLELTADVYRMWGTSLLEKAADLPPEKAEPAGQLGRAQLRRAGSAYLRLAGLQIATRKYTDWLWASAEAYLQGQDYKDAIRTLRQYLKNESRRRHPQALVYLGESMLALDQCDEALEAFRECYELHPRDPASYRARLMASKAYLEKDDLQQAETLLQENINGEHLTPDSKEWRDSLFALGELLRIDGRYREAIRKLEEAVQRYPDDPQAPAARYMIADTYRQAALSAQKKLRQDLPGADRLSQGKQIREDFETALLKYEELREMLSRRQETAELTPREKLMLRNSYFAIGDIHFRMEKYESAIKALLTSINRYQSRPASLLAYVQIANAQRRLNQPVDARATLERAKAVLARMKTELPFAETTNYSRQQWEELLDSLSEL